MLRNECLVITQYPTQYSESGTKKEDRCIVLSVSDRNIVMLTFKARTTLTTKKVSCECVGIMHIRSVERKYAAMNDVNPIRDEPIRVPGYYVELE